MARSGRRSAGRRAGSLDHAAAPIPTRDARFRETITRMDHALDVAVEEPEARRAVIVFKGEHDLAQVEALGELLSGLVAANELVVADFSEAEFVDSSIINLLVETRHEAEARKRRFRIQMGTECVVYRVFELTGVLSLLECASSREEALDQN
jgi:anti-anti-sigma factor